MFCQRELLEGYLCVIAIVTSVLFISTTAQFSREHNIIQHFLQTGYDAIGEDALPEGFLTTKELITANGFGYEQHKVQTEDGYIVGVHRILTEKPGGPPLLIYHGLMATSEIYVVQERDNSLGFILADAGFDVWLADIRGNWYSKEHVRYKQSDPRFWDYTLTEVGYYDLPAVIDEILKISGHSKLFYIGHSLGTTIFVVMGSVRPEYNEKIKCAVLLAPIAWIAGVQETTSFIIRIGTVQAEMVFKTLFATGVYELLPRAPKMMKFLKSFCSPSMHQDFCLDLLGEISGEHRENLNLSTIANFLWYIPAGSSTRLCHHYSQISKKGFRQYDYGVKENRRRYNSDEPPEYRLEKVTAPIAIFWAQNDHLAPKVCVEKLVKRLPNIVKYKAISDPKFNHVDYLVGLNKIEVLYDELVSFLLNMV